MGEAGSRQDRHEDFTIITVHPPSPQNQLYEAMEEVVEFLEVEHRVRVRYSYLSPLGLCLVQFHSLIVRQILVDQSSLQLDVEREVIIQEHDRGINVRSCPFTRTCWVMFLAFLLDFQTREIISQVVSLFGSVATWTNNHRCKSRILL